MRARIPIARRLRRDSTGPERCFWNAVRSGAMFGAKVRRQVPIGPFIVDFAVFAAKIVIELDGETHAEPERADADRIRDAWLAERDWRVLRFSNREIAENLDGVLQTIAAALQLPHPGPLPEGEGAATGP